MNEKDRILGVKRNVFFLGLVSFFNDLSAEMVQSVMPVFLTVTLGAPAFAVGLIEGVADALASVLKFVSGWVSDLFKARKNPAVAGYALSVFTRLFLSSVTHFSQVLTLRVVDRIGKGLRDAPRDALIVDSVDKGELGKSFGFHRSLDTLGATFGPLFAFAFLMFEGDNYRTLFAIAFFLGLFALASFAFVKETRANGEIKKQPLRFSFAIFTGQRRFVLTVLSIFVFGLGTLPIGLLLLKAKEVSGVAHLWDVPLMYFVYSAAFVATAVPLGKLADRIGETRIIAGGFFVAIAAYLGLAWAQNIWSVALFFAVLGLYGAATDGLQRVLAAKSLGGDLVATGQGFLNMALGFSSLFAGIIGGLLWTIRGSGAALLYAAALSFLGLALFVFLTKK